MRKKLLAGLITGVFASGLATTAFATSLVTYEFTISGKQLMRYVTADGASTDSAMDVGLYEDARKFNTYDETTETWGESYRSYQESSKDAFTTWANRGDRLVDFNLWGYDGNASNWGETYKVYDWANTPTSTDTDWAGYVDPWPSTSWGNFDDYADNQPNYGEHYNDGQLLGWWMPPSQTVGLGFGSGEADAFFTFQMTLNMDDPAFNGSSPWHNGQEGQMVFWFGGWMVDSNEAWTGRYEGNIILQGQEVPVPEPATMLLFGVGMASLVGSRFRRKKK